MRTRARECVFVHACILLCVHVLDCTKRLICESIAESFCIYQVFIHTCVCIYEKLCCPYICILCACTPSHSHAGGYVGLSVYLRQRMLL